MMPLAGFLALVADSIELFEFSPLIATVVGLVLGELSKAVHNALHGKALLGIDNT